MKHFIAIAKAFKETKEHMAENSILDGDRHLKMLAENLCVTFKQLNPEFRRQTFMDACGLGETYAEKVPAQMHGAPLQAMSKDL